MGRNLSLVRRRQNARGFSPVNARRWPTHRFLTLGMGNRAKASLGTGNSAYVVWSKVPGTPGNTTTFRVVVAGANTAASASMTGTVGVNAAVTFNAATNGASAAISTVNQMIQTVGGAPATRAAVQIQPVQPGTDGNGVVAAVAATALAGAV